MRARRAVGAALLFGLVASGCGDGAGRTEPGSRDGRSATSTSGNAQATSTGSDEPTSSGSPARERKPLTGRVVVLDPGHQLGNRHHRAEIGAPVDAGGFEKACNTTGTATAGGYPEATFTWEVAQELAVRLRRAGARVVLTRERNSDDAWGPCVDERGTIGNPGGPGPDADLRISIHGDGSAAPGDHGFHVIRPGRLAGWTDDVVAPSRRLARVVRDQLLAGGFVPSTYRGVDGIDVRTDLGTLNLSDVPVVMVELGNMRHPDDAGVMTSRSGQRRFARTLAAAVAAWFGAP